MTCFLIRIARGNEVVCLFEGLTIGGKTVDTSVEQAAPHKTKSKPCGNNSKPKANANGT